MTKLPEKKLLDGSKDPRTSTKEMREALGNLRDYLSDLLGDDSTDKASAREALGIDLGALDERLSAIETGLDIHATKAELATGLAEKQDTLTFDTTPLEGSSNPVTSDGIKTYIERQVNSGKAIVNADWNATSGYAEILNRPDLAPVATSGNYHDLEDKPQTLEEYGLKNEVETDIINAVHESVPVGGTKGQALVVDDDGQNCWKNVEAENVTFNKADTRLVSTDTNSAIVEVDKRIPVDTRVRNTVLCGREVDGMPAYLATHETYWMPTFKNTAAPGDKERPGCKADVFCSSTYANSATYSSEIPLVNQKAVLHGNRYITVAAVTDGFWGVRLKEPQVFTMVEVVYAYQGETPQTIQIQATNDDNWDNPVNLTGIVANKKFGPDNLSKITKDYARRYWFNDNITSYKSYRLFFGAPMTPTTYAGSFLAVRFFRHPDENAGVLGKNDAILISNEKEPFVASIAKGLDGDQKVFVGSSVVIPGSYLAELSRNYCYIVPANDDGSCPDYVNASKAIRLDDKAWLVVDHRKINYGEQSQIEKQCLVNVRCDLPDDTSTADFTFSTVGAGYVQGLRRGGVTISADDRFRGSKSAFVFPSTPGGGSKILPDTGSSNLAWHQNTINPRATSMAGTQDWTFEVDLKYTGPDETNDDSERTIFDVCYGSGSGDILAYCHRRGYFELYTSGNWYFKWPYVLDDQWHTVALSHRKGNVYLHVDGRCLGAYTGYLSMKRGNDYWCLGRQAAGDKNKWTGKFSSFRYIVGDALYCSDDYTPSPVFHVSVIPNGTLWYDHRVGVVKTWNAENETWLNTPMCPIGHIDTLYQEHLHSEAPRGMQTSYGVQNIKDMISSGNYSGSYPPAAAFNFGNGAVDWLTPTNNTTVEHWLQIELESPMSFDRLRLIALTSGANMWSFPAVFLWQGSHDGNEWTTLVDRSAFVRDGMPCNGLNTPSGATVWWFCGMKQFAYDNETAYRFYRLVLPPKSDIPYFNSIAYTGARLQLPLRGETPEIASCTSYATGGIYTVGPFMVRANQEIEIPVPFGGAPFEIDGEVEERYDWQSKRRKLGNSGNYPSGSNRAHYGEEIYSKDDSVVIYTAQYLTTLLGKWNVASLDSASDLADYTITFKRKF